MIRKNKMSKAKTTFFWLIIFADILLLVGWLGLSFLTWRQVSLNSVSKNTNQEGVKITVGEMKRFFATADDKVAVINASVVNSENVNSVVDQILDLASVVGVEATIDTAKANSDGLELEISSKGDFGRSVQFLRLMEKLPYRLAINKENLVKMSETSGDLSKVKAKEQVRLWRSEIGLKILSYRQ